MWHESVILCLVLALAGLTILAAGLLGVVFVTFTVSGRVRPIVAAIVTGIGAGFLGAHVTTLPRAITLFMVPLIAGAIAAGVAMSRRDWKTLGAARAQGISSTALGVVGIVIGIVSAYLSSLTSIGKWVLNSLGQDVIGNMPNEAREIRVTGAICGFFVGCFAAIILARVLTRKSAGGHAMSPTGERHERQQGKESHE